MHFSVILAVYVFKSTQLGLNIEEFLIRMFLKISVNYIIGIIMNID